MSKRTYEEEKYTTRSEFTNVYQMTGTGEGFHVPGKVILYLSEDDDGTSLHADVLGREDVEYKLSFVRVSESVVNVRINDSVLPGLKIVAEEEDIKAVFSSLDSSIVEQDEINAALQTCERNVAWFFEDLFRLKTDKGKKHE
jgi:hypothetical protein